MSICLGLRTGKSGSICIFISPNQSRYSSHIAEISTLGTDIEQIHFQG